MADSLVEFVRADRQTAGYILAGLAVLLVALCGWTIYKAGKSPAEAAPEKQKKADSPFTIEGETPTVRDPNRDDYYIGAVASGAACLVALTAALWLMLAPPALGEVRQRTDIRALVLALGGLLGGLLILAGIIYFYMWSGALTDWLDKKEWKQAKWTLYPLLMVVGGAALMFLAAQPARAEERTNSALRKLVYGANLGLSTLLLFVALVVINLFVGPRLPNKLDTTATGFYTLSAGSKEYLGRLNEPVTAYAILPESGRAADDIRRLLESAQEASAGRFTVRFVSTVANKSEYRTLAGKYPVLESNEVGVLLTVGEDQRRHSFIREDEFIRQDAPQQRGQQGARSFVGESRLMRELLFLMDNEKKAVVYFTQSAGELGIEAQPGAEVPPDASAVRLRAYLEKNYLDVRSLKFDATAPKVPDDAAVVIVAEPRAPLAPAHVAALTRYMNEPRGEKRDKKGKLIILAGARFDPNGKVVRTGLEEMLQKFNVRLGDKVVVGEDTRELDPLTMVVGFTENARRERNPVAIALGEKTAFMTPLWRPVAPVREGGPAFRATALLVTAPGRVTWLEQERPRDLNRIFAEFRANPQLMRVKEMSDDSRPVGVVVSEGDAGRIAVFGSGLIVSDRIARQAQGSDPITFDLVGGTVDWLRDRPPLTIGVETKRYKEFHFPPKSDETRGLWLPLLIVVMAVAGLGTSIWVIRRR